MQLSRVANRASTQHKLFMLAVPFRSVNRRAATMSPPGQAIGGPLGQTSQSHILHVGRPMGVAMEGELL